MQEISLFPLPVPIRQQYDWLQERQELQPVYHDSAGVWHIFRYEDVQQANHLLGYWQ